MTVLGNGLFGAKQYEDALSVLEARLSLMRRLGASQEHLLVVKSNLASTYQLLGRHEEALSVRQEAYSGRLKLHGEEHEETLAAAHNYALSLKKLERFEEAKTLLRKVVPVARRVLGDSNDVTLRMRWTYAKELYASPGATLDDLREAVATLEDTERTSRRVFGGAHPHVRLMEGFLRKARAALRARETPGSA